MKLSPYPLEQDLGICCYITDTPGILGKLRAGPEDFAVEEVPLKIGNEGKYLICKLTKTNWELQRVVKEIAKNLGISHRRISWSGTKDKNAVTTQLISLYDVDPCDLEKIHIPDIVCTPVGRSHEQLQLGKHAGNLFKIIIRDFSLDNAELETITLQSAAKNGIPNYFGLQRFGVTRPVTHTIGLHLLKGEFQEATLKYIGGGFPGENPNTKRARDNFSETNDTLLALKEFPRQLTYERALLQYLHSNPNDYQGAILSLPPRLISLFVSAFQSLIFNLSLSARLKAGIGLLEPVNGDRLIFADGRVDRVNEKNIVASKVLLTRGRSDICSFITGNTDPEPAGLMDTIISDLMVKFGIRAENFKEIEKVIKVRYNGALRPISLRTFIDFEIAEDKLQLKFELKPGQYATIVCRELMKSDPISTL